MGQRGHKSNVLSPDKLMFNSLGQFITDVFWLGINAYHEARGESTLGIMLTCYVVLNRTASKRWPESIYGVIHQKHQFSWVGNKKVHPIKNYAALLQCLKLAAKAYVGWHFGVRYEGINHYHRTDIDPLWSDDQQAAMTEGSHVFFIG